MYTNSLPEFNFYDYPEHSVDYTGWEGFNPGQAVYDIDYRRKHITEASSFVKYNLKVGNPLLLLAIGIATGIRDSIPKDVLEYALKKGGPSQDMALRHLYLTLDPPKELVPLVIAIIQQAINSFTPEDTVSKYLISIKALGKYKTPEALQYLTQLTTMNVISENEYLRNRINGFLLEGE